MNATTTQMLADLRSATLDAFFVPNTCEHPEDVNVFGPSRELEVLPEEFQNHRDGGRTLAELDAMCEKRDATQSQHEIDKAERMRRAELYRQQVEQQDVAFRTGEEQVSIDYDEDNDRLYRKQLVAVASMVNGGMIEADELEE